MLSSLNSSLCITAVLLAFFATFAEPQVLCTRDVRKSFSCEDTSELYLQLERALVERNDALLDNLRTLFLTDVMDEVNFELDIQIVDSPRYVGMHSDELEKTGYSFCNIENADNYTSKLCKGPLLFRYFEPAAFSRAIARSTTVFVTWSTLIHGNWFSLLLNFITYRRLIPEENNKFVSITLNLERLSSNPTYGLLACNINDLFSWIKWYAESGGKPNKWDREYKGTTSLDAEAYMFDPEEISSWVPDTDTLLNLCLTEYVFVSLSMALIIARFLPAIHSRIVARATSLESQSLYWGTAVVSNMFVFGLLLVYGRVITLFFVHKYHPVTVYVAVPLQVLIYVLFLIICILPCTGDGVNVPIPKGMAKILIYISFSFAAFLFCTCRSKQRKAKILQVMVTFSLLTFVYHLVMEVIATCFALLVNVPETITLMALSTLSLSFFVMFSYTIIVSTANWKDRSFYEDVFKLSASVFTIVLIFGAFIFSILVYMLMLFRLQPDGIAATVSTLLPPVILSAAGWYIRMKLPHVHMTTEDYEPEEEEDEKGSITTELSNMFLFSTIEKQPLKRTDNYCKIETIV